MRLKIDNQNLQDKEVEIGGTLIKLRNGTILLTIILIH